MLVSRGGGGGGLRFTSVVVPHHFDADPDSTFHPDTDPDPDFAFYLMRIRIQILASQIKAQTLEKLLK